MSADLLKNPIIIGGIASLITYFYMKYDSDRKHKKNPKTTKKNINLLIVGIVGIIVWYISANYFDNVVSVNNEIIEIPLNVNASNEQFSGNKIVPMNAPNIINHDNITLSSDDKSYHLVSKGQITVPNRNALNKNLPEMFIELNNF